MVDWGARDIGTLFSGYPERRRKDIQTASGSRSAKSYSTITVLNRDGEEVQFPRACPIEEHVENLGSDDAVVLEASCASFYCAGRIEGTGATCFVLDANRFRIITEKWNKIDKQDARNLAKTLWIFLVTGEFGIPTVY
jgi:transposase